MVEISQLAQKIFSLLKGHGLQVTIFTDAGAETTDPAEGRRFFVMSPNIMITIDEDSNTVAFGKGSDVKGDVADLQKGVRKLADEFLLNSDIKVFGKSIQPRDFAYQAKMKGASMSESRNQQIDESLTESFSKMFGTSRVSQQTLENVRILVKHATPVDESVPGSRSRRIAAIFLECNEERFRFPYNYLPGARAMAQHLSHGGTMTDKVGAYVSESTNQLLKLQSFSRYVTSNKLINEDSSGIIETVKENIETLRAELRKLTGVKTYETVRARIETFERKSLAEDDVSQLKDLFTIRRFDEKFEEVLPIVKQLVQERDTYLKRIEEAATNIVRVRRDAINTAPIFEFASSSSKLGYKLSELALRIIENDELSEFVSKIGNKLVKESLVNDFEKAIVAQILENISIVGPATSGNVQCTESTDLDAFYDRYIYKGF